MSVLEAIETLKRDIVGITKDQAEKIEKGQLEFKELTDKVVELQKELADRKVQFEAQTSKTDGITADVAHKADELYIAQALMRTEHGQVKTESLKRLQGMGEYKDAIDVIKATGLTFGGQNIGANIDGNYLVPTGFSSQLYREVFLRLQLAAQFGRMTMGAPHYKLPFLLNRIRGRKGAEATAPTKDKAQFDQLSFDAKKIMANLEFTYELDDDALIPVLPLVREELVKAFALIQDEICLNGDTTTGAGNINGDISGADAEDGLLVQNGIRKLTGSGAQAVDFASGGLSADNLRSLRTKMGKYGISPSELFYAVSVTDYNKILGFSGYQFLYQYGAGAVIANGELGKIDGIPIIVSELVPSTGLGANGWATGGGTKGTVGLINKTGFLWGDWKQLLVESFRYPLNQTTNLIGSQRLDFQKITSPTATPAAFGVNY